jgi:hypothetical protein
LAAVADALSRKKGRSISVWIPDYFCDQALWPLRQQNTVVHFYPVDQHARPDWSQIEVTDAPPDLFLLVHYFGHANDCVGARKFCDQTGALLIEDGAQTLGPDKDIGEAGDVVLYSPWKFFQAPNGAFMTIRPRAEEWVESISRSLSALGSARSLGFHWLKTTLVRDQTRPDALSPDAFFEDPQTLPMRVRPKASPVSRPILSTVNVEEAGRRRRENDEAIRAFFHDQPHWRPMFPERSNGPMRTALRLDSPERASVAHNALRAAGLQAEGWPGLPPEVRDPDSWAIRLRRTAIYLPCHQDLNVNQILLALEKSGLRQA